MADKSKNSCLRSYDAGHCRSKPVVYLPNNLKLHQCSGLNTFQSGSRQTTNYSYANCKCKASLDKHVNICTSGLKSSVGDGHQRDKTKDFAYTYRRVHQAADLIVYDKHPQSVTKSDFTPKVLPSDDRFPNTSGTSGIQQEINRLVLNTKSGKKSSKLINYNPAMIQHRDCANSSFKRVLQGNELRIPKDKRLQSVTKTDFPAKPFDANIYPFELEKLYDEFEEPSCGGRNFNHLLSSLENRNAIYGPKKENSKIDYNKDADDESSTFLRVMQAADYNKVDPNPISQASHDFRTEMYEQYSTVKCPFLELAGKAKASRRNCVNMLELYKNLPSSRT